MAHRLAWGPDQLRDLEGGLCPCSHLELKTKCEQKYKLDELQKRMCAGLAHGSSEVLY